MNITYLGTAASEGIPALFCECPVCKEARHRGGKDIRTTSQAQINGEMLIDLCPDTYMHFISSGMEFSRFRYCLVTHSHGDHLDTFYLRMRRHGFAHLTDSGESTLSLFGSEIVGKAISAEKEWDCLLSEKRTDFRALLPYTEYSVGEYKVTALPANHIPSTGPYLYVIEHRGSAVFYGNDTGMLFDEVWGYLAHSNKHFDLVSLDCTFGNSSKNKLSGSHHNNLANNIAIRERMLSTGVADQKTVFLLTHFSHNGNDVLYDDLCRIAEPLGFSVAYDGISFNI